jgi:glutathione synthase/RimK-type ligase-like ATP-grasp enzyme
MQFGNGLVLLGNEYSKRTEYFLRAAGTAGIPVAVMPLSGARDAIKTPSAFRSPFPIIKIDPPETDSAALNDLNPFIEQYRAFLRRLGRTPGLRFLNSPEAILQTLDKRACKQRLERAGLPVTPLLAGNIRGLAELRERMETEKLSGVFIKPRYGSGAAGVIAFRRNPKTGEEIMYTPARRRNGALFNTRRIRRIGGVEAAEIAEAVLVSDAVVEEWIPKASYGGKVFDLRVVFQFGHAAYMVARQSRGQITNLHLSNGALPVGELGLGAKLLAEIEELCRRAAALFPGLNCAGFDILLEKDTLCPRIIEINGQGDLIHQDIYGENIIYREQIQWTCNFAG